MAYLGGMTLLVAGLVAYFASLDPAALQTQSSLLANGLIFGIIMAFMPGRSGGGWTFTTRSSRGEGGVQRGDRHRPLPGGDAGGHRGAAGERALDMALDGVRGCPGRGLDARWVEGLPTAFMKPLSGSGARGMMIETMTAHGADSFAGRLACVIQGSTETTFYVLAVYFGAVGIRKTRHAVACGLLADLAERDRGRPCHLPLLRMTAMTALRRQPAVSPPPLLLRPFTWAAAAAFLLVPFFVTIPVALRKHPLIGSLGDLLHIPLLAGLTLLFYWMGPLQGGCGLRPRRRPSSAPPSNPCSCWWAAPACGMTSCWTWSESAWPWASSFGAGTAAGWGWRR